MPAISTDSVMALIEQMGPVLPTDITSRTGQNTMIVGAILSTLVAEKRLKMTDAKWGGSRLYYAPQHIELIQKIYPHLNEKDRRAFDMLKQQLVIEDSTQTPLVRACLRQIKDFAFPLTVTGPDGQEFLFWKWYLLSDADAQEKVKQILTPRYASLEKEQKAQVAQQNVQQTAQQVRSQPVQSNQAQRVTPVSSVSSPNVMQSQQRASVATVASVAPGVSTPSAHTVSVTPKQAKQKVVASAAAQPDDEFIGTPMLAQKQKEHTTTKSAPSAPTFQSSLLQPVLPTNDDFFVMISTKLQEKQVGVVSATVIKKNSELDLLISMPTPFGSVNYYAKARKKKKSTDADLSSAYVKAQMLHLPCAYISLGELTKKAQEMLKTDFAGMLTISFSE